MYVHPYQLQEKLLIIIPVTDFVAAGGSKGYAYPAGVPYPGAGQMPYGPQVNGGYVVQQQPGHSLIIRPGQGITQVPGVVTSV